MNDPCSIDWCDRPVGDGRTSAKKCDRCGKFTRFLHAIPSNPAEGGWDHEQCCACRHPGSTCPVGDGRLG